MVGSNHRHLCLNEDPVCSPVYNYIPDFYGNALQYAYIINRKSGPRPVPFIDKRFRPMGLFNIPVYKLSGKSHHGLTSLSGNSLPGQISSCHCRNVYLNLLNMPVTGSLHLLRKTGLREHTFTSEFINPLPEGSALPASTCLRSIYVPRVYRETTRHWRRFYNDRRPVHQTYRHPY